MLCLAFVYRCTQCPPGSSNFDNVVWGLCFPINACFCACVWDCITEEGNPRVVVFNFGCRILLSWLVAGSFSMFLNCLDNFKSLAVSLAYNALCVSHIYVLFGWYEWNVVLDIVHCSLTSNQKCHFALGLTSGPVTSASLRCCSVLLWWTTATSTSVPCWNDTSVFLTRLCHQGPCRRWLRGPFWRRVTELLLLSSTPACSTISKLWLTCSCSSKPSSPPVSL